MMIEMKHDKSKMTIHVLESQVKNAEYYGWYRAGDNSETKSSKSTRKRVKKDGESNRE